MLTVFLVLDTKRNTVQVNSLASGKIPGKRKKINDETPKRTRFDDILTKRTPHTQ